MTWRRLLAQPRDRGRPPGLRRLDVDRRDGPDVSGRVAGVPARPVASPLDAEPWAGTTSSSRLAAVFAETARTSPYDGIEAEFKGQTVQDSVYSILTLLKGFLTRRRGTVTLKPRLSGGH